MRIDHSKIMFLRLFINNLFMRQHIKIQNISNTIYVNKYEINNIKFLRLFTNVVVTYRFENSEDELSDFSPLYPFVI